MALQTPLTLDGNGDLSKVLAGDSLDPASLGGGTASSTTFLRGDGTWSAISGAVIEDVVGTTYSFVAADQGKIKRFTNAAGCTATIPASLGATWNCMWERSAAAGALTFAASGTTVVAADGASTLVAAVGRSGAIIPEAVDVYQVTGMVGNLPVTLFNGGTGASSSTYLRGDGIWATPAGGGGGGSITTGTVTIEFLAGTQGTGSTEASVVVTEALATATSVIMIFVDGDDTTVDHTANDHRWLPQFASFVAGSKAAGSFNIYGRSAAQELKGLFKLRYALLA